MPTQTQHAACSQAPGSATQRARPLLPTCSWFLLMQTRLLLLPAKGVWHRQPRPGGRLRGQWPVRVSSESAGRRWPGAPRLGAGRRRARAAGGKQAPGRTRRFGARIWRGGKEQRAHEHEPLRSRSWSRRRSRTGGARRRHGPGLAIRVTQLLPLARCARPIRFAETEGKARGSGRPGPRVVDARNGLFVELIPCVPSQN